MIRDSHIHGLLRTLATAAFFLTMSLGATAQADRHDVRAGNRKFRKENYKEAEIDYRKAVVKDSTSFAGEYNLANTLYRQEDFDGAGKAMDTVKEKAESIPALPDAGMKSVTKLVHSASDYYYNQGDIALQKKDYAAAVEAFKQSLLRHPEDLDAKENYIYAKLMLQNQQNGGGGGQNDQDQDQQQDQNQNQNQDQQQDQNQDQNQDQDQQQNQQQEPKISPQQAQQMLQAIQAREKETQDKVNKEKAAMLKSRQKEKNW